jgi:glutamate-5-semialdehyde dehydrogenase
MSNSVLDKLIQVKQTSYELGLIDENKRNQILRILAQHLRQSHEQIIDHNQKDLANMDKNDPRYDRLLLSQDRIAAIANDLDLLSHFPYPNTSIVCEKKLPNGLILQKTAVPLGVVAIIYESRPNVTIDSFALCFKSGNACVLKGGKEAVCTNQYLVHLIHQVLDNEGINKNALYLLPLAREALHTLLSAHGYVDVCIPRGSQSLIDFVREHARIPFIETGAGIVHTYLDKSGDPAKARQIIDNAKTRRVSVCNALDTLLVHKERLPQLIQILSPLAEKKVEIYADEDSYQILTTHYPKQLLHHAKSEDFGREFLSHKMAIKTVDSVEEAVAHIRKHGSGHSEAIIAEEKHSIDYFLTQVDAAAVYLNASTAFTDGGQFGMGAEIGISTQKLHARGPMGLEALSSYKWVVLGDGHIRGD